MPERVKAGALARCARMLEEMHEPLRKGSGSKTTASRTDVVEKLRVATLGSLVNKCHQPKVEQLRMDGNDPLTGSGLQALVRAPDQGLLGDYEAPDIIDHADIAGIELADFVETKAAVEADQRYPEAGAFGPSISRRGVAVAVILTPSIQRRGEHLSQLLVRERMALVLLGDGISQPQTAHVVLREEFLTKNHMRGLRLADPVAKQDKRHPFSDEQLRQMFTAPLYRGCKNDGNGYTTPGDARPKGTRFWIPLIGLYSGLRLNEICQLDTSDVRMVDDVRCFVITEKSLVGSTDKSLKTRSSERIVPVHPKLLDLGLVAFVDERSKRGDAKLFHDICPGGSGFRSTAFSKWFVHFLKHSGASRERTSFHSFRHRFRDALRDARVDRDISLAIGGWGTGKNAGDVSDNYGRGYRASVLFEEISKVQFSTAISLP